MATTELDEIVKLFNQLEQLNDRPIKENNEAIPKKIKLDRFETFHDHSRKISDSRKGSLSVVNGQNSKGESLFSSKPNKVSKLRKSLFYYDRSYSLSNLSSIKLDNQIFPKYSDQFMNGFGIERNESTSQKLQQNTKECNETPVAKSKIYKDEPELDSYFDLISSDIYESSIHSQGLSKTKDSMEVNRKILNKHRLLQPVQNVEDHTELNDAHNKSSIISFKSPRNSQNKLPSIPNIAEFSTDSPFLDEIPSDKLETDTDTNHIQISSLNEGMNRFFESCSDISDSLPTSGSNEMSSLEADEPTITDRTDKSQPALKSTKSFTEIITVQSEEDKTKFLQWIAKDMSMKSYSTKEIIRFNMENGTFSSQVIDISQTASSVCILLKSRFNISPHAYWQIIEIIQAEALERPLEDHENILQIYYSWKYENNCNRFLFRENPNMYKIFSNLGVLNSEMECDFEIEDFIWVKEPNARWKKFSCFISDTTIYFKIKPDSKNHKDFYTLLNLKHFDFYTCSNASKIKKSFKAPTNELIVFKSDKLEHKSQEHPCICFQNGQLKEKWMESLKIAKFSFHQLKQNYINFEKKSETISRIQSYSKNPVNTKEITFNPSSI